MVLGAVGLPSPAIAAGLLVGVGYALRAKRSASPSTPGGRAAQATVGVVLGGYVQSSALTTVAESWLPIAAVGAATLLLSIGAGAVLARLTGLDPATGTLGMVAGGAAGIVGMADDLGADSRLVAFMQYIRVLAVVLVTPAIVALTFGGDGEPALPASGPGFGGEPRAWLLTAAAIVVGVTAAKAIRLPAGSLLGPMIVTAAVALASSGLAWTVPPLLRESAFVLIGLQVGLRFTIETIRDARRLLLPVLVLVAALMAACFGMAVALDLTTSASLLDAYLATTPGGLYAVLASAYSSGAETTFVVSVQTLRLFVMLLLAPLMVRALVAGARRPRRVRTAPAPALDAST